MLLNEPSDAHFTKNPNEVEKATRKMEGTTIETGQLDPAKDHARGSYGNQPLNQSPKPSGGERQLLVNLTRFHIGQTILFRARLTSSRVNEQGAFLDVRQRTRSIHVYFPLGKQGGSLQMINWIAEIPAESIVLIEGVVCLRDRELDTMTVIDVEIRGEKVYLISSPEVILPFDLTDASRAEARYEKGSIQDNRVHLNHRLDNRVLDLRTATNQAIFALQSAVTDLLACHLRLQGFTEIHSPKLQGEYDNSGSTLFKVGYFKGEAYLAPSPQFAKQMCIAADFERVFEIGPVFRAEDSLTHRHLTEFICLDLEMTIEEHYHEVVDLVDETLKALFRGLRDKYHNEIEIVGRQFPAEEFKWREGPEGTVRITFKEGVDLLVADGVEPSELDDFNTANEKRLGAIIKQKYDTDFFIMDKFPLKMRPFFTMPDPNDPMLSNAYDFFMRGEEILSGSQRIHNSSLLVEQMKRECVDPSSVQGYINTFKLGCPPHGGCGIGLERVLMLFLKLDDIRRASLFPRDSERLSP